MFYGNPEQCYKAVIAHNEAKTGQEETVNDTLHFGMGIYAYVANLEQSGVKYTVKHNPLFGHLTKPNLKKFIKWLWENDIYLYSTIDEQ